ncbi:MAG: nucleoside-diphosphate kinase [Syntrophomonadaceae bacterium]|nr:nucleoside-diphosphate kinase [Syntrophomonadaceae bacterium]
MERTFVMVKPDAVQRGLIGEIIKRLEIKGFKLLGLKMIRINEELARRHYAEHEGKPFFEELVSFITSGPAVAMVWEGNNVIASVRSLMGDTDPVKAAPGTIRGDLGASMSRNVIHGSDGPEAAEREINLFFKETEILEYEKTLNSWIF